MKKIFIDVNPETNRVEGWGSSPLSPNSVQVEVEDNHDVLFHPFNYVYIDCNLILDKEYRQKLIKQENFIKNKPTIEQEMADLWYAVMIGGLNNA